MSIDRELLEMAAKAAGIPTFASGATGLRVSSDGCKSGFIWNPLTDDGDALRLAVKLNILTYQTGDDCSYASASTNWSCTVQHYDNDALTSTRRAIVMAAAEIGKAMP